MPRYKVSLLLGFQQRPSRDEQAFLGELDAQVQPWGISDLHVVLDVEAPDMVGALGQAKEMTDPLGGNMLMARVADLRNEVRPGSLWQRLRRRNP